MLDPIHSSNLDSTDDEADVKNTSSTRVQMRFPDHIISILDRVQKEKNIRNRTQLVAAMIELSGEIIEYYDQGEFYYRRDDQEEAGRVFFMGNPLLRPKKK